MLGTDACDGLVWRYVKHHCVALDGNIPFNDFADESFRVFRACEFLLESVQTEAWMNALSENTAKFLFALKNQNVFAAAIIRGDCGGESCRATANYDDIM
jgi:hypothetical protein